jgi:hypothetical protein
MAAAMRHQEGGLNEQLKLPALAGRAGYDFNKWFSVERSAGTALEDQTEVREVDAEFGNSHFISALARVG